MSKEVDLKLNKGIRYMMSFLGVLVQRAGGSIVIENLSEFAGRDLKLAYDLDVHNDKVTLTITEMKEN